LLSATVELLLTNHAMSALVNYPALQYLQQVCRSRRSFFRKTEAKSVHVRVVAKNVAEVKNVLNVNIIICDK